MVSMERFCAFYTTFLLWSPQERRQCQMRSVCLLRGMPVAKLVEVLVEFFFFFLRSHKLTLFFKFSLSRGTTWCLCLFRVQVCEVEIKSYRRYNSLQKHPSPRDFTKSMIRSCPSHRFPTSQVGFLFTITPWTCWGF